MSTPVFDVLNYRLERLQMVEASAGTGKTWTLCALFLRLLLERGLEVQRILVVTFTNAASAELRERIRSRLVETLSHLRRGPEPQDDAFIRALIEQVVRGAAQDRQSVTALMVRRLELALAAFDEASIFTIHGFCRRALSDIPFSAQMPLSLELIHDDMPYCTQVAADYWRQHLGPGSSPSAWLLAELNRRKDSPQVLARYLKRHQAWPMAQIQWPTDLDCTQGVPLSALEAIEARLQGLRALWQQDRSVIMGAMVQALETGRSFKRNIYKLEGLKEAAEAWDRCLAAPNLLQAHATAQGLDKMAPMTLLASKKMQASKTKEGQLPAHAFHEMAQQLLSDFEALRKAQATDRLRFLRDFLATGLPALQALKAASHVSAFDDLLSNLQSRLSTQASDGDLKASLRQRFAAALIDEFQDTDPLQWSIFESLYAASNAPVFLVGDPKQAIYSFRNADLHTYLRARQHSTQRHALAYNQRSSPSLIQALNALFQCNPKAFMLEGLDYPPVSSGQRKRDPFSDPHGPSAALQWWWLPQNPHDPQNHQPCSKSAAQDVAALATAKEVARLLQGGQQGQVTLGDRGLQGRDIAVLVRSHREGSLMREALARVGVLSVELARTSIFASPQAQALEALWTAVLQPAREPLIKAALSTEWWGLDAQAIANLTSHGWASEDDSSDPAKRDLAQWMSKFQQWRDDWRHRGVAFMCRRWMDAEHIPSLLLSQEQGERRLTNLLHLIELAHEASHQHASPEALLTWLKTHRQRVLEGDEPTDEAQLRLESDRNLVQIVTIHKSKGLEYPVVFCPFLWKGGSRTVGASLDGLRYQGPGGRTVIDYRTDAHADPDWDEGLIKSNIKLEDAAESLRLMYVALTRAIHRCVVVAGPYTVSGSTKESQRALLNWWVAGAGVEPSAWLENGASAQDLAQAWQAFLSAHTTDTTDTAPMSCATLDPLDAVGTAHGEVIPVSPSTLAPEQFVARTPAHRWPAPWRMGSFSSLVHGTSHEAAASDRDGHTSQATDDDRDGLGQSKDTAPPGASFLNFPRGAQEGDALHGLLESIDFGHEARWDWALDRMATRLGASGQKAQTLKAQAREMLGHVLNTPLPVGTPQPLQLAQLDPTRRRVEMEFHLPSPRLEASSLRALMQEAGMEDTSLAFSDLTGYLKGYIDLVFEHDGRFFVLDWKSNHLGSTAAHYAPAALRSAMTREGYHLQALLYSLAVHRWLGTRWRGYNPQQHWGGVIYLFLRGVRPGWQDAQGHPAGLHFHRTPTEILDRLSAWFPATGHQELGSAP